MPNLRWNTEMLNQKIHIFYCTFRDTSRCRVSIVPRISTMSQGLDHFEIQSMHILIWLKLIIVKNQSVRNLMWCFINMLRQTIYLKELTAMSQINTTVPGKNKFSFMLDRLIVYRPRCCQQNLLTFSVKAINQNMNSHFKSSFDDL